MEGAEAERGVIGVRNGARLGKRATLRTRAQQDQLRSCLSACLHVLRLRLGPTPFGNRAWALGA